MVCDIGYTASTSGLPSLICEIRGLDSYSDFSTQGGGVVHYTCSYLEILGCSIWSHASSQCVYLGTVRDVPEGSLLHETIMKAGKG